MIPIARFIVLFKWSEALCNAVNSQKTRRKPLFQGNVKTPRPDICMGIMGNCPDGRLLRWLYGQFLNFCLISIFFLSNMDFQLFCSTKRFFFFNYCFLVKISSNFDFSWTIVKILCIVAANIWLPRAAYRLNSTLIDIETFHVSAGLKFWISSIFN